MSRTFTSSLLVLVSTLVFILGCSGSDPVTPGQNRDDLRYQSSDVQNSRWLWGQWEIAVDLENETISAIPLRTSNLHFNVVPLLYEGTLNQNISFANLAIDNPNKTLFVDITLKHPFPSLKQVPGFDVKGILFTRGEEYGLTASNTIMAGQDEPRLSNADGYTRWWNPDEFPVKGLFGYNDGKFGTSDQNGGYKINIAGYKLFADELGALDTMEDLTTAERAVFRAGESNTRRYLIEFGSEPSNYLVFNYAVDANWGVLPGWKPSDGPPDVPSDFPFTSNQQEPYRFKILETMNSLSATDVAGTSGTLNLTLQLFDWRALDPISTVPMEVSIVQVEVPQFGIPATEIYPIIGSNPGTNISTYTASITGNTLAKLDYLDVIFTATSSEGDWQNGVTAFLDIDPLQSYFMYTAKVKDNNPLSGWTRVYSRSLYPEFPNQGVNNGDLAVYNYLSQPLTVTVDQANLDPNQEGGHAPDSINVWGNEYETHSDPEHYHLPLDPLSNSGLWNDISGITVSDAGTRLFFSTTNHLDEFASGDDDPLYCYLNWVTHTYLGNQKAAFFQSLYFSNGAPRFWATDPSNGVKVLTDYIYSVFLYDNTGLGSGDPGVDPQRYIILRWTPPYEVNETDADWLRPSNVPPSGSGVGYVDRDEPWKHRLAVDDQPGLDRVFILDSVGEIEVINCDFSQDEFVGATPSGTVTIPNLPVEISGIVDIEVVQTTINGTPRNEVAALCITPDGFWRVWLFDFEPSNPIDTQAVTVWLSEPYDGVPLSVDCLDDPTEIHVLNKIGGFTYATVFRYYP
ncbi:MAG TPA: hypothetical protein VGB30_12835 [bacterium]|jgi:hypothetical protein